MIAFSLAKDFATSSPSFARMSIMLKILPMARKKLPMAVNMMVLLLVRYGSGDPLIREAY